LTTKKVTFYLSKMRETPRLHERLLGAKIAEKVAYPQSFNTLYL